MIITHLSGGLGNQMFQYAAGLALAERWRTPLKLDVSTFREYGEQVRHDRYSLGCFNLGEQIASEDEIARLRGYQLTRPERWLARAAGLVRLNRLAALLKNAHHTAPTFGYYPEFEQLPYDCYLEGHFQSEKFFAAIADLLRLQFTFRYPALPAVVDMQRRIREDGPSAALHFRRGDYVANATYSQRIGVLDLPYYERAIRLLREKVPGVNLYVFSDDIDAVEREFRPEGGCHFVRVVQPWHAYDEIRLMSQCDHAIIANSTFSWWAAWLNPAAGKVVIAPDPWFSSEENAGNDIISPGWTRLPRKS